MRDEAGTTFSREESVLDNGHVNVYLVIRDSTGDEVLRAFDLVEPGTRGHRYVRPGPLFEWRLARARKIVDRCVERRRRRYARGLSTQKGGGTRPRLSE